MCAPCVLRSGSLAATPFMSESQNPELCVPTSLCHGLPLENLRPSNPEKHKRKHNSPYKEILKVTKQMTNRSPLNGDFFLPLCFS